jgi:hypothetical protein
MMFLSSSTALERRLDGRQRDAVGAQTIRIDLDLDLTLEPARELDVRDAIDRLEPRQDVVVRDLEQLVEGPRAGHCDVHDRPGVLIRLGHLGRVHRLGEPPTN